MEVQSFLNIGDYFFKFPYQGAEPYKITYKGAVNQYQTLEIQLPPYINPDTGLSLKRSEIFIGSKVIWQRGYSGQTYTRFVGYVQRVKSENPIIITCYGVYYNLFNGIIDNSDEVKITYEDKSDKEILESLLLRYRNYNKNSREFNLVFLKPERLYDIYYEDVPTFGLALQELAKESFFNYFVRPFYNRKYDNLVVYPADRPFRAKLDLNRVSKITPDSLENQTAEEKREDEQTAADKPDTRAEAIDRIKEVVIRDWCYDRFGDDIPAEGNPLSIEYVTNLAEQYKETLDVDGYINKIHTVYKNYRIREFGQTEEGGVEQVLLGVMRGASENTYSIEASKEAYKEIQEREVYSGDKFSMINSEDNILITDDIIVDGSVDIEIIPPRDMVVIVNIKYTKSNRGRTVLFNSLKTPTTYENKVKQATYGQFYDLIYKNQNKSSESIDTLLQKKSTIMELDTLIDEYNETGFLDGFRGNYVLGTGTEKYEIELKDITPEKAREIAFELQNYFLNTVISGSITIFGEPFIQVGQFIDIQIKEEIFRDVFVTEIQETMDGGIKQTLYFPSEPPFNDKVVG